MKNRKRITRALSFLLSLTLIMTSVIIMPLTALAVDDPGTLDAHVAPFWADPENTITPEDIEAYNNGDKTAMTGAVAIHKRSGSSSNYYFFLPSNANCNNLKIWYSGVSASIDGVDVQSGEATDAFKDVNEGGVKKTYQIVVDTQVYNVTAIKSGDVGTVYIDTESGSIASINNSADKSVSESGTIMVTRPDGTVDYDGALKKMKGRGNATWSAKGKKNPYNINLDKKAGLLGMAKSKKWCLLANDGDSTLLKNQITYDFAEYIGVNYQVVCKPVDLYVNQQYLGSYQLAEKVEIGSERINISDINDDAEAANPEIDTETGKDITDLEDTPVTPYINGTGTVATGNELRTSLPNASYYAHRVGARRYSPSLVSPADVTGGYLYELEISNRWVDENAGFCAYNRQGWVLKNCDAASKEMVDYSYDLLYALGSSVYNGGVVPSTETVTNCSSLLGNLTVGAISITNPAPSEQYQGKKWSDLLDAESAVKLYWTQELFKNLDSSTSSTYFYKDKDSKDSKLYAGPMWDMDKSFGNGGTDSSRWGVSLSSTSGWYTRDTRIYRWRANDALTNYTNDNQAPRTLYGALCNNCPDFWQLAKSRWYSLVEPATRILLGDETDSTGTLKSIDEYVSTIAKSASMNKYRHNLDNDSEYDPSGTANTLKNWLSQRAVWISGQLPKSDISTDTKFTVDKIAAQSYTGNAITPGVTVRYDGNVLIEGTDYEIEYSNNILPTNYAAVVITGKNLYEGEETVYFAIKRGTLTGGIVSISESAFPDDVLKAEVKNANGESVTDSINYQWYRDGEAIDGETSDSYTAVKDDIGKTITVKATGNGDAFDTASVTSNACEVTKYINTEVLASWNYDYTAGSEELVNADESGESYYYLANGGKQKDDAKLCASVTAQSNSAITWSGDGENYINTSNTVESDQSPVIGTDKTAGIAWGEYPYFETVFSTTGYTNIKFSAKLGGSKKAPRDYKLQYSLDGTDFSDVDGATYSITTGKTLEQSFNNVVLPEECNNKSHVYLRMVVYNDIAINGTNTIVNQTSGDAAVNNIVVTGDEIEGTYYTVKFVNAAGETVSETEYEENTPKSDIVIPENTAAKYDTEKHYSYSWGEVGDVTADVTYNEIENAELHEYKAEETAAASCSQNGEIKYTCECGYSYTSYTDKTAHTPGSAVKENVTSKTFDEVVYCKVCKEELSRKTVVINVPSGTTPSSKEADSAKENGSIVKVNSSKITTAVNIQKKTLTLKFNAVSGATNYRVRYRKAGAKSWTYAWTGGKNSYTIKKLAKSGLYQFQIAVYVYNSGAWQRSKYSNTNYRYFYRMSGVKAKAGKKKATVSWKADKNATGYDIAYSTSKNGKKTVKTVKGKNKKSYTFTKLKKGKKYYVMVRSYKVKSGKKYTGQWTTKTVKVK